MILQSYAPVEVILEGVRFMPGGKTRVNDDLGNSLLKKYTYLKDRTGSDDVAEIHSVPDMSNIKEEEKEEKKTVSKKKKK